MILSKAIYSKLTLTNYIFLKVNFAYLANTNGHQSMGVCQDRPLFGHDQAEHHWNSVYKWLDVISNCIHVVFVLFMLPLYLRIFSNFATFNVNSHQFIFKGLALGFGSLVWLGFILLLVVMALIVVLSGFTLV